MKKLLLVSLLGLLGIGQVQSQTCTTTISTFPHIEDFQSSTVGAPGVLPTGWTTSPTTGYRYQIEDGQPTSGTTTGPAFDHTTGNATTGKYVYTESSSGVTGDITYLNSPCINLTSLTSPGFDFWYHMHGATTGTMEAQISSDNGITWITLTTLTGPQQMAHTDPWLKRTVSLAGYTGTIQIRFKGTRGTSFTSDMAIDDVKFYNIPTIDAELIAITSPNLSGCGFTATENVTIQIKNNGIAAISSIPVSYTLNTNPAVLETTPASLVIAPGATGSYTFNTKANLQAGGNYTLAAAVALPSDGDPSNNSKNRTINNPLVSTFPHIQDFQGATVGAPGVLPAGWTTSPVTGYRWEIEDGQPTSGTTTGPAVDHTTGNATTGKYVYTESSSGATGDITYLNSPCIDLTSLTSPGFDFWYHMHGATIGTMEAQVSSNGGTTWTTLSTLTGPQQTSHTDAWLKRTVSLAGYTGIVQIRFKGTRGSSFTSDMAIDDVKFYNIPTIDAELIAITAPAASSGCAFTATENVTISIKNNGIAAISSIPVRYTLGTTIVNEVTPASLTIAPGATGVYTFTAKANLATAATYTLSSTVLLVGDGDPSNDAKSRSITVVPNVSTFPYIQNFENGNGGWVAGGANSSWALGTPAGTVINSAGSGTNSWVTNLTGNYNASENSQVSGPCFNMSSLVQPIISMKIWWESESGWDGAVLQSSINGGATWQNVGALNDPDNWYNAGTLIANPGGQPVGWAGTGATGSGGWVTAKHALTGLGGQSSVLLRIAFAADGSVHFEGFGFDDVSIFESPANDVGIVTITSPNASGCGFTATENVCISITNFGSVATTTIPLSYQIGTNPAVNEVANLVIAPGATANYCFTTKANLSVVGTYNFTFTANLPNDGNPANNSATRSVTVVPTISTLPYSEGFENGNGGWIASGTNSSWAIGTPAKPVINTAGTGTNSYVTGLTGTYNASEVSQVISPCFNFTGIADPDFEMKAWWSSEGGWDGAVLQSSIDGGLTWQNVGALNDPNNWYNAGSLIANPGGQPVGWAGTAAASSGGWVRVKHKLNGLGGQGSVRLRIAFAADGSVHFDGFAFDDIRIGDNTGNMAINNFVPLTQLCGFGTNEKVEVVLENLGSTPLSNYTVSYTVSHNQGPASPAVTVPGPSPLAPNAPFNFVFSTGANLSAAGTYSIVVTVNSPNDPDLSNNTITYNIANATFPGLPPIFNFETGPTGTAALRLVTNSKSAISESPDASRPLHNQPATSTKGMLMEASSATGWVIPAGILDPWANNPDHRSAAYICFTNTNTTAPMWLSFDLKQIFKTANANTNFRVTVNGNPIGGNTPNNNPANTYRPTFSGVGGTADWTKIYLDLDAYKSLPSLQIGFESSVAEPYANGAGTANLVDNIRILRSNPTGVKDEVLQSNLSVFPNPSTGIFSVSVPAAQAYTLEVTDLTGKVIKTMEAKGNTQIDLKGNAQGVYMLKITSKDGMAVRKLIIE